MLSFSTVCRIEFVVTFLYACLLLFYPQALDEIFGLYIAPPGDPSRGSVLIVARFWGIFFLFVSMLSIHIARSVNERKAQKSIAKAYVLSFIPGIVFSVYLSPLFCGKLNNMIWTAIGAYLAMLVLFVGVLWDLKKVNKRN